MASLFIEYITNKFIVYGTYVIITGAGLRLRHIRKNQIQKLLLYLLKLSFSFLDHFNVRVYGHMKFEHTIL
jgi:hypothetical protein